MTNAEDLALDSIRAEVAADFDEAGARDSPEGDEIKRVTWQKQRQPDQKPEQRPEHEADHARSKARPAKARERVDTLRGPKEPEVSAGKRLQDGDEEAAMSPAGSLAELQERNRLLEAALKERTSEGEAMQRDFDEERAHLHDKIECLELANEQLLAGGENSGMEQLQMELTRLQKHNAVLAQRERELQFQLSTKDMLQKEVQHLQELNEQLLDTRLPAGGGGESESGGKMLERIVTLETELAEAMEVNNLYKSQLHTAFAEQQSAAAPPNTAGEAAELRARNAALEADLQELRDRFFVMSIRLAETEAQHEEALMKLRRLQNPLRTFGGSFKW